jgi:hypothetical protein
VHSTESADRSSRDLCDQAFFIGSTADIGSRRYATQRGERKVTMRQ